MANQITIKEENALLKERIKLYEIMAGLSEHKQRLSTLREMTDVQCTSGNWDYDNYMHGLANGMIYAISVIDDCPANFLDAPAVWLKDKDKKQVQI